jgi:predicted oxidoreductase
MLKTATKDLTTERKHLIQKKVRQLLENPTKAVTFQNEDGSINIEKLSRAVATTNSLSRNRGQVADYIKTIFHRDQRANEIIAEEMKNFNVKVEAE